MAVAGVRAGLVVVIGGPGEAGTSADRFWERDRSGVFNLLFDMMLAWRSSKFVDVVMFNLKVKDERYGNGRSNL